MSRNLAGVADRAMVLAFTCRPTVDDDGHFILSYSLLHASGERLDGTYPLPTGAGPHATGSAITYARRYTLCAVTGAVAEDDDDAAAAEHAARAQPAKRTAPAKQARPAASTTPPEQQDKDPVVDAVQTAAALTLAIRDTTSAEQLEQIRLSISASVGAGRISDEKAVELVQALEQRAAELTEGAVASKTDQLPRATQAQLRALHAILNQCGWTDRADKLRAASALVDRPLASSAELSKTEAGRLIDQLQQIAAKPDPATALTDLIEQAS